MELNEDIVYGWAMAAHQGERARDKKSIHAGQLASKILTTLTTNHDGSVQHFNTDKFNAKLVITRGTDDPAI